MRVKAVVLAGKSNDGVFAQCSAVSNEALLEAGGRPIVWYVLEALRRSPSVEGIVVVGPEDELGGLGADLSFVAPGADVLDSARAGAEAAGAEEAVLVCTSDLPLLTPEAVEDFVGRCREVRADLYYPIVARETVEARFPETRRTYGRVREGSFTGANLFLLRPRSLESRWEKARGFIDNRKKPLRMARLLGLSFLVRVALARASIGDLERKVEALFGVRGRAIICPHAEIAIDVDKLEDLSLVEACLGRAR